MSASRDACPCGSGKPLAACCGPLHDGTAVAQTAEQLMRSRYSAFVLGREAYALASWHPTTRPAALDLDLASDTRKWLGLDVRAHRSDPADPHRATVEFVARFRVDSRGHRMHETSRFVREDGRWLYVDGTLHEK